MTRLRLIATLLGIVALLLPAPLLAQAYTIYSPGIIETPHVHLGSATEPSVVQIPPVVIEQSGLPIFMPPPDYEPGYQNEEAACMPGEFDYVVAPAAGEIFPGSMADTAVSLGEYARDMRAHRGQGPPPIHLDVNSLPPQ